MGMPCLVSGWDKGSNRGPLHVAPVRKSWFSDAGPGGVTGTWFACPDLFLTPAITPYNKGKRRSRRNSGEAGVLSHE